MKTCFSVPKMCSEVCRKYLRYDSEDMRIRYARAMCYYMIYDDRYLKEKGIDLQLLAFLIKILRNTYNFPRSLISNTTLSDIEKANLFR